MASDVAAELPALLESACGADGPCSPAMLYLAGDASAALIGQTLAPLAKELGKRGQTSLLQLRFDDPTAGGPPPMASPKEGSGSVKSGHLDPPLIQTAVRARFGAFRLCYEQGLVRNHDLTGKVTIRFVIDLEGKISAISADEWQTSMPDSAVTKCVVEQFKATVFPPPVGGIVTVVYPIMFAPGN